MAIFFDDIPTHTHFEFHENQALKSKVSFFLGKKHGNFCQYNDQGVLLKKTVYRNGLKHGLHLERYPSGKIKKKILQRRITCRSTYLLLRE